MEKILKNSVVYLFACLMVMASSLSMAARTTTYLHNDALGSVVAATNEQGQVIWRKDYAAFGERAGWITGDQTDEAISYTGKQYDDKTGLIYFGARYYDPEIGRFISRDPAHVLSHIENNPHIFNRYAYANNNPYKFIDPDGRFSVYVETAGTGHVGIQTNYNGNKVNYDFGRYKGKYKGSLYSGPGIYKRTKGTPSSAKYQGYEEFHFSVSQELDNAIAQKFRDAYDSGDKSLPPEVLNALERKSQLSGGQTYSGSDWGLTGPNCVTHTFSTLKGALKGVADSEQGYSESVRNEAASLYRDFESLDTFVFSPHGAKKALGRYQSK
ncbi:RHS repeat-associated core domain-containing protein [Teredinibacter sp. KSP-S5-2]|uniref:RHS repeat domain-containing protein n=1 Tax=Teredinibacter sp. KSP-S5-2 TaxID=3034506 RepID=UPI002934AC11|nr:RHS repeat-associated core domain-containing protein [Teredinibacter sp. KSP-S5-2]WNO10574.1 RHS repeat-associated core domain-containing protein [Teredinibacter sp. KSP-S5-2]